MENEKRKRLTVGITAHVDAGKTTLSESMLYLSGSIGKLGRVDRRDSYLDHGSVERQRGITVFSKQALLTAGQTDITLIDTPGHIDFSCEAERSLAVQDYTILVISAVEGVQAHTKTLWHLLRARRLPVFLFINKTDIAMRDRAEIMDELRRELSPRCVNFSETDRAKLAEDAAAEDEVLMRGFFDTGALSDEEIADAIAKRGIFPCFFGSALKLSGVGELLAALDRLTVDPYPDSLPFGGRIYKIARDGAGVRLSYLKITGGVLHPKDLLRLRRQDGGEEREESEKIEEIRLYSGEKYKAVKEAHAGEVVAIPGLLSTYAGMGIGTEQDDGSLLSPVLDYRMEFPGCEDIHGAYLKILPLAEEEPSLGLAYDEQTKEVRVHLMGDIQAEVLTVLIYERFGVRVSFGEGRILYRETIAAPVVGNGHFEPLRHYAEVRLLLEPLPRGSGLVFASLCPTDLLAMNWQRLVLTHLEERVHRGVLTGSPITDMKISLLTGRAHLKHTEGGDFRQATYRAVRQGLMKAESILLEPTFDFRIELPAEHLGRAMTDIANLCGVADPPEFDGDTAILTGNCPVATMRSYAKDLRAYTRGEGKLLLTIGGYIPCHNAEEVIASVGYDPETDLRATPHSVFCRNGAGYVVPWQEADGMMHTEDPTAAKTPEEDLSSPARTDAAPRTASYHEGVTLDKELERIFEMTYGKIKPRKTADRVEYRAEEQKPEKRRKPKPRGEEYLIVDGYNLIYAWPQLKKIADGELSHGREMLTHMLANYTAFRKCRTVLVFDAYRRKGGEGSVERIGGVTVVYTKEAQTADAYIEKSTHEIAPEHVVRVVTSDMAEQFVILGNGALRVTPKEFIAELQATSLEIREYIDRFALGSAK